MLFHFNTGCRVLRNSCVVCYSRDSSRLVQQGRTVNSGYLDSNYEASTESYYQLMINDLTFKQI
jgi:hypothetical protein